MTKKSYQKRLPAVLPPAPRPAPPQESLPPAPRVTEEPPQPRATPRRSSGIAIAAACIAGLLVSGVVAVRLGAMLDGGPETPADADRDAVQRAVSGLAAGESYVHAQVLSDGRIVVRQWIRTDEPIQLVRLNLPRLVSGAQLRARDVHVIAEGDEAVGLRQLTRDVATYTFNPATEVRVGYVLSGAVDPSDSAEGRALAVVTTLEVDYAPPALRETRVVQAPEVLALACSPSPADPPVPCGVARGTGRWQVELEGDQVSDRVVAQLNLE